MFFCLKGLHNVFAKLWHYEKTYVFFHFQDLPLSFSRTLPNIWPRYLSISRTWSIPIDLSNHLTRNRADKRRSRLTQWSRINFPSRCPFWHALLARRPGGGWKMRAQRSKEPRPVKPRETRPGSPEGERLKSDSHWFAWFIPGQNGGALYLEAMQVVRQKTSPCG